MHFLLSPSQNYFARNFFAWKRSTAMISLVAVSWLLPFGLCLHYLTILCTYQLYAAPTQVQALHGAYLGILYEISLWGWGI